MLNKIVIEYYQLFEVRHNIGDDVYRPTEDVVYFNSKEEADKYAAIPMGFYLSKGSVNVELIPTNKDISNYKIYSSAKEAAIEKKCFL